MKVYESLPKKAGKLFDRVWPDSSDAKVPTEDTRPLNAIVSIIGDKVVTCEGRELPEGLAQEVIVYAVTKFCSAAHALGIPMADMLAAANKFNLMAGDKVKIMLDGMKNPIVVLDPKAIVSC